MKTFALFKRLKVKFGFLCIFSHSSHLICPFEYSSKLFSYSSSISCTWCARPIIGLHHEFGIVGKVWHIEHSRTGLQSNSSRILAVIDLYISIVSCGCIVRNYPSNKSLDCWGRYAHFRVNLGVIGLSRLLFDVKRERKSQFTMHFVIFQAFNAYILTVSSELKSSFKPFPQYLALNK